MSLFNTGIQTCVICGEQVETKHVLSNVSISYTDLDTRPRGVARTAEKNCVHFCPNCGYSSYNLEKDITFGLREILKTEEYLSIFNNQELDVDAKKFYLMGIILDEINEYQRAATAFLRASWFFNDIGNKEWMIKSKKRAIKEFLKSEFTWRNEQVICILVDLYRRIEKFDYAIETINRFGLQNVKDKDNLKILEFQLKLSQEKDSSIHTTNEIL
jgi:uncharacterized protein (DUF2225 family)